MINACICALAKTYGTIALRVNPNVKNRFWLIICQCWFIYWNKHTTLVWDVDGRRGHVYVGVENIWQLCTFWSPLFQNLFITLIRNSVPIKQELPFPTIIQLLGGIFLKTRRVKQRTLVLKLQNPFSIRSSFFPSLSVCNSYDCVCYYIVTCMLHPLIT
jgi:hypothetical protein